jgi:hypothetical protein
MNVTLLRNASRTLLAVSALALALYGHSRAEGETRPLPNPAMDAPLA